MITGLIVATGASLIALVLAVLIYADALRKAKTMICKICEHRKGRGLWQTEHVRDIRKWLGLEVDACICDVCMPSVEAAFALWCAKKAKGC